MPARQWRPRAPLGVVHQLILLRGACAQRVKLHAREPCLFVMYTFACAGEFTLGACRWRACIGTGNMRACRCTLVLACASEGESLAGRVCACMRRVWSHTRTSLRFLVYAHALEVSSLALHAGGVRAIGQAARARGRAFQYSRSCCEGEFTRCARVRRARSGFGNARAHTRLLLCTLGVL